MRAWTRESRKRGKEIGKDAEDFPCADVAISSDSRNGKNTRHKLRPLVSNEGVLYTHLPIYLPTYLPRWIARDNPPRQAWPLAKAAFLRLASTWARAYDSLSPNGSHADIHGEGRKVSCRRKAKSIHRLSSFLSCFFLSRDERSLIERFLIMFL